jgi:hypothetical protein
MRKVIALAFAVGLLGSATAAFAQTPRMTYPPPMGHDLGGMAKAGNWCWTSSDFYKELGEYGYWKPCETGASANASVPARAAPAVRHRAPRRVVQ